MQNAATLTERIAQGDAVITCTRVARQVLLAVANYRLALELHVIDNGPGCPIPSKTDFTPAGVRA